MQETINQRLKFLIQSLGMSVRAFSSALGAPASTTRNYLDKDTKPSSDYIERIVAHFDDVNLNWLVAGKGEPFLSDKSDSSTTQTGNFNQAGTGNTQKVKGTKTNVQANTGDHAKITNNVKLEDCKRDLATSQKEVEHLRAQLAAAEALAASKDVTIAAKEETISLLRATYNRPN